MFKGCAKADETNGQLLELDQFSSGIILPEEAVIKQSARLKLISVLGGSEGQAEQYKLGAVCVEAASASGIENGRESLLARAKSSWESLIDQQKQTSDYLGRYAARASVRLAFLPIFSRILDEGTNPEPKIIDDALSATIKTGSELINEIQTLKADDSAESVSELSDRAKQLAEISVLSLLTRFAIKQYDMDLLWVPTPTLFVAKTKQSITETEFKHMWDISVTTNRPKPRNLLHKINVKSKRKKWDKPNNLDTVNIYARQGLRLETEGAVMGPNTVISELEKELEDKDSQASINLDARTDKILHFLG
jgi:hypothetical protein